MFILLVSFYFDVLFYLKLIVIKIGLKLIFEFEFRVKSIMKLKNILLLKNEVSCVEGKRVIMNILSAD